jgi:dolichol kinase
MSPPALRRIIHASSAAVLLLAYFGSGELLRYGLAAGAAVALVLDWVRVRNAAFGLFVTNLVPVFRASESNQLSGATWLSVGYAVAAWFPTPAATAGILAGAFADPAASLVGSRFAVDGAKKTWPGSCAAAVASALALLIVGIPSAAVIAGAAAAMVLERWPGPFNDNLLVAPGVSAAVLLLI